MPVFARSFLEAGIAVFPVSVYPSNMENPWRPQISDIILAAVITLVFPFAAGFLFDRIGALLPMLLYYGMAWGITIWRRGSSGYFNRPLPRPPIWFYINVGIIILALVFAFFSRVTVPSTDITGVLLTGTIWAVLNASSEQLLWIYIFEACDLSGLFSRSKYGNLYRRAAGLILFSFFVGAIHMFFWVKFLHTVDAGIPSGIVFVILTSLSGYLHLVVWKKGGEMLYTFIPHFLLNLFPLFWTGYSILPYLVR